MRVAVYGIVLKVLFPKYLTSANTPLARQSMAITVRGQIASVALS